MLTDERAAAVATGPRVSLADLEAKIAHKCFVPGEVFPVDVTPALRTLTLCVLVMQNGFFVIGKSAPVSPDNYDAQLGRDFAYEDAVRQAWQLEGYLLKESLQNEVPQ